MIRPRCCRFAVLMLGLALSALACAAPDHGVRIARAAQDQVGLTRSYDPAYRRLDYPGGDVPIDTGVCADVVVRALRAVGIDLQRELHVDMRANFAAYPANWGLKRPDRNIDHRRVANLRRWFERRGWSLPVTNSGSDYQPGDVVSWTLADGRPHIGIVSRGRSADDRPWVVHNIAAGAREEDVLFAWQITGHYRKPGRAPLPSGA